MSQVPFSRNSGFSLLGLLVTAACLRFFLISDKSTFVDEVLHITWAKGYEVSGFQGVKAKDLGITQEPGTIGRAFAVVHRHNPPLHQVLLNLWMRTLGSDSDFALRSMYAAFSVLAVLAMYAVGYLMYGPSGAIIAAALMALSPFQIYYAHEVNHYAPAVFFFTGGLAALLAFLRTRHPLWAVAYVVCTTIACFGHYYVILSVLAQFAALASLLRKEGRAVARTVWLPLLPLVLVALDRHAIAVQMRDTTPEAFSGAFRGLGHLVHQTLVNVSWTWFGVLSERLPLVLLVLGAGLVAGCAIVSLRGGGSNLEPRIVGASALLPYAIIGCAYLVTRKEQFLWPRYSVFASGAVYLLLADAMTRIRSRVYRAWIGGAVLAAMVAGFVHYHATFEKQPWRKVADLILRQGNASEPVIVHLPNLTYALGRYLRTENKLYGVDSGEDLRAQLGAALSGARSAWLVLGWVQDGQIKESIRSIIACRLPERRDHAFHELEVSRYTALEPGGPATCDLDSGVNEPGSCVLDETSPRLALSGWIASPDGRGAVRIAASDGRTFPVARAPRASGGRISFEGAVSADQLQLGRPVELWPELVAPDTRVQRGRTGWRCLRRPEPSALTAPGIETASGYLDSPTDYQRLRADTQLRVRGWVFSTRGIDHLSIAVDGQKVAETRAHGAIREDVAAAFPDAGKASLFSGFDAPAPSPATPGTHTLVVSGHRADGSVAWASPARQVVVADVHDPERR